MGNQVVKMITIRQATAADTETIVRFNRSLALETEDHELPLETVRRGVGAVLDDPHKGFYLIAEMDGETTGCLLITTEWSDWRDGYFWWIQSVFVSPDYRRHGVYRALHEAVAERARETGNVRGLRLYVDRENASAQRTYEKLGMTLARYDLYETLL